MRWSSRSRLAVVVLALYPSVSTFAADVKPAAADTRPTTDGADAAAAAPTVNPEFTYWTKFKVGSTVSMAGEAEVNGQKLTATLTSTLVEIAEGAITIKRERTFKFAGTEMNPPAENEVVKPAPKPGLTIRLVGEDEVVLAGKTLKCRVYETREPMQGKTIVGRTMVNDAVPGGAVKMTVAGPQMSGEMRIVSFEAK